MNVYDSCTVVYMDTLPLDPTPYLHDPSCPAGCDFRGMRRSEETRATTDAFVPREGYAQNREDYA